MEIYLKGFTTARWKRLGSGFSAVFSGADFGIGLWSS
jgi:hypothetical protein